MTRITTITRSAKAVLESAGRAVSARGRPDMDTGVLNLATRRMVEPTVSVIELLYVENIITRKKGAPQQRLTFYLLVENRAYGKEVAVRWAGEDGEWHTMPAAYVSFAGDNREIWRAQTWLQADEQHSLPGNIHFALHCRMDGQEYWAVSYTHLTLPTSDLV